MVAAEAALNVVEGMEVLIAQARDTRILRRITLTHTMVQIRMIEGTVVVATHHILILHLHPDRHHISRNHTTLQQAMAAMVVTEAAEGDHQPTMDPTSTARPIEVRPREGRPLRTTLMVHHMSRDKGVMDLVART